MQNMIYQDFQYFQQLEKGALLSRAQNLFELSQYFIEFYHVVFIDCVMLLFICGVLFFINVFLFVVTFIMMGIIFIAFYFYNRKLHIENKKIIEQKERLNDGILEYQENFFQTIQFKIRKMMKNKLAFHYDEYFKNKINKYGFETVKY